MLKKSLLQLSLALFLSCFCSGLFAQNSEPQVYKDWQMLGESKTHIDVFYRVLKCTTSNQVHLFVFNESPNDQTALFNLEVINDANGQRIAKDFSIATVKANMYRAECNSTDATLNALKIDLPADYDPTKISLKLTFKP